MKLTPWILTLIAAAGLIPARASSHAIHPPAEDSDVTVYFARIGPMANAVWKTGETTALQLFGRIGVHLRFANARPAQPDSGAINLLVLNRAPKNLKPHVLGAAKTDPEYGPVVFVFYDRVLEFCASTYTEETGIVLGYVIAHELGHALRSEPGHSQAGVMKGHWDQKDAAAMLKHLVSFTRADSERIHLGLADRKLAKTAPTGGN